MGDTKFNIVLDEYEQGVVINALLNLRNNLLVEQQATDYVDDVLLKICKAPERRFGRRMR